MVARNTPSDLAFLDDSDTGRLARAYDWSRTSIGPIFAWPQSLKTTVGVLLRSPVPIVLLWGPDGVMIYNDAYSGFAGGRHPRLFGSKVREGWPEVADFNDNVMKVGLSGGTLSYRDQELTLYRKGVPEQVWMNLDYSPVIDESGRPAGVLAIVVETTDRVLAERALATTKERLSYALSASGMIGTFDWHVPSDTFYSDARFAAMFSVDPEKGAKGAPLGDYLAGIHPDDVGRISEAVNRAISSGETYIQQYRLLHRDGTVRWVEARGECIYDQEGRPLRFPGAVEDITERKQAELALRESEERRRMAAEAAQIGVWDYDLRTDALRWDAQTCALFGLPPDASVSYDVFLAGLHPDDRAATHAAVQQALDPGGSGEFDIEYRTVGLDDGITRWVAARGRTYFEQGQAVRFIGTARDVTGRRKAEEVERWLAAIIESSDDAIISKNLNGIITSWNRGAELLFGYRPEEVIGKPITILIPEDRLDEEPRILERLRRGERVDHFETIRRRKDGGLIDVSLTISPVRDARGMIVGASKITRDITEQKRAERLQQTLVHELNHRVKNILATVQAIARQSFRSGPLDSKAREIFEARLHSLSNAHDLLTRANWNGAEMAAVVSQVLAPYPRQRFDIDGPKLRLPPRVALALTLALHELATNAAKYGALSVPSGRVAISWTIKPGDPPNLAFRWQERGGPQVSAPTRKGFGSRLIERSLALELAGEVSIIYDPAGLICEVSAPVPDMWTAGVEAA